MLQGVRSCTTARDGCLKRSLPTCAAADESQTSLRCEGQDFETRAEFRLGLLPSTCVKFKLESAESRPELCDGNWTGGQRVFLSEFRTETEATRARCSTRFTRSGFAADSGRDDEASVLDAGADFPSEEGEGGQTKADRDDDRRFVVARDDADGGCEASEERGQGRLRHSLAGVEAEWVVVGQRRDAARLVQEERSPVSCQGQERRVGQQSSGQAQLPGRSQRALSFIFVEFVCSVITYLNSGVVL